ncbi:hypothetical protein GCM10012275_54500 [Longimycelium tulufanense]|uniref:Uncharacterized protein n=1 Tax=Longimycelium tulufanense TaxID=907463 RepID=A0A8J3CD83_9PSEU|nr:minor capsid protein [Longimycelium tulufanense]GGM76925.1 hypothetical protein GCM10012275_54500 [Longimycelium tulufanense]
MTKSVRIRWNGAAIKGAAHAGAARGLRTAAEHVLTESRRVVPIEEGTLERSGVASVDETNLRAAVTYDTPYAVRQHEDLTLRHDPGRKAKYLEDPLTRETGTVHEIVSAEIRRSLR